MKITNIRHFLHVPGNEQWLMNQIYDDGNCFTALRYYHPIEELNGYKNTKIVVINLPSGRYTADGNKIIAKWEE